MKKWKKILFKDQGFPDNYYDPTEFLKGLQTNVSVVHYTLYEAVSGASFLASQINMIVLYFVLFESVQNGSTTFKSLLLATLIFSGFCFLCHLFVSPSEIFSKKAWMENGRSLVTTLTTTISTDSIYTMATLLFMSSLIFHDYGMEAPLVNSAFSLNLALAASICLISRLETDALAFCFLALALSCFCFWPNLRNSIAREFPETMPWILDAILPLMSVCALATISIPLAGFHLLEQVFVLIFCPILLVAMQHLKSTIHGPWDEATLNFMNTVKT
uniref:Phosphatidylinositol N-acetylglucosaminyltransferase subunit C n=1 Tax=Panagrolaimus sp. JU765 TaxID=591449 RepID=A0AC34QNR9_9BILA